MPGNGSLLLTIVDVTLPSSPSSPSCNATRQVEAMNFTTPDGPPSAYLGCPHPQAFLDPSVGGTVAPAWHLGPCILLTEVVDIAPYMFALGPEYTGLWTAESPLTAVSSANATRVLRHLQVCDFQTAYTDCLKIVEVFLTPALENAL